MSDFYKTFKPEGFHTVTPYVFAKDAEEMLKFLADAFYAKEMQRTPHPETNTIMNAIIKIGDSCFMIAQARPPFDNMQASFYLYTSDVDHLYENALKMGGLDALAPTDMDYGDRQAGIIDPHGNYWWISMRLMEEDY